MKDVALELHRIGAIKFGEFELKSGVISPFYIDLRLIVSYPKLLKKVALLIGEKVKSIDFDLICGVPYTALPIATAISLEREIPMCMRRKEAKAYGTKKMIEGVYKKGDRCLVVEDVITSGASIFETLVPLEEEGLEVYDIAVFLDRQGGGREKVEQAGYHLHSVLTITDLLDTLAESGRISGAQLQLAKDFIK